MKKIFALAAFAVVLAVSCQKNDTPATDQKPAGIPMKLIADFDATKITYAPDGNVLKASWEATETISVITLDEQEQLVCIDNFTSTGAVGREKAEFTGTFNGGDSPAGVIVIYPALSDNGAGQYATAPYIDRYGNEHSFIYDAEVGSEYIQDNAQDLKQAADNDASHLKNYCILSGVANIADIKTNTLNVTLSHEMIVLKVTATFPDALKGKTLQKMIIASFDSSDNIKGWSRRGSWEYINIPSIHLNGPGSIWSNTWDLYADFVIPDSGIATLYFVNIKLQDMEAGDKLKFTATVNDVECTPVFKTFNADKTFDKGSIYRISVTIPD